MKTVKEIYDYFLNSQNTSTGGVSLMSFLNTLPEFNTIDEKGLSVMNMSLGQEYLRIVEKMCGDMLLLQVKQANIIQLDGEYIAVHAVNSTNPDEFIHELEYGMYDCKYQGFVQTRSVFEESVLPIVGINKMTGDEDLGTCYYIGDNMFVTAAHCVLGLSKFNVLLPDNTPIEINEVWFAKDQDPNDYDLAIIHTKPINVIKAFELRDPQILDKVLNMGYPPIPGLNPILISETASVASYVKGRQQASIGQIVANASSYMSPLDFFVITARVKGGNSGGPVINENGYVVGTVFQLPFDSKGGSDGGRYDIMGYGICLPSKYVEQLIKNRDVRQVVADNGYFKLN